MTLNIEQHDLETNPNARKFLDKNDSADYSYTERQSVAS